MTTISSPEVPVAPSGPVLRPVLSARCALTLPHVLLVGFIALLLVLLNLMPLRNTDLWSHVDYGQWIMSHRALPSEDPWMPLAEGMPLVDSAWGSQVLFALVDQWFGPQALSNLFAVVVALTYVLLARILFLQSASVELTFVGLLIALGAGWSRLATVRPEMFAVFFFVALIWLLVQGGWMGGRDRSTIPTWRRRLVWIVTPVLFVLWANMHGSFLCGVVLLGCLFAGQALSVAWQTRSLRAVFADVDVRQSLPLAEFAAAATLLNPYGMDLWINVMTFARNANVRDLLEWSPMVLMGVGGREFVACCVLWMICLRFSRRTFGAGEMLALSIFAILSMSQIRMLGWFAPLAAVVFMPHVADIWERIRGPRAAAQDLVTCSEPDALPPGRSWKYSLLCVALIWVAFALSGLSKPLLGGKPRTELSLYGDSTPLGLTAFLKNNPPQGQAFNPEWWGDWLVHAGPAGFKPFATTHVHLLPAAVWRDYKRISGAEAGWETALDRYRIDAMVIDKKTQSSLANLMKHKTDWRLNYEDDLGVVYTRVPKDAPSADSGVPAPHPTASAATPHAGS